jgi:hypothetical protein
MIFVLEAAVSCEPKSALVLRDNQSIIDLHFGHGGGIAHVIPNGKAPISSYPVPLSCSWNMR